MDDKPTVPDGVKTRLMAALDHYPNVEGKIRRTGARRQYLVPGRSGKVRTVNLNLKRVNEGCDCEDHSFNGGIACFHIFCAAFFEAKHGR